MKIVYSSHLQRRLAERKIPESYPRKIIENPENLFLDSITHRYIAIKKLTYKGKLRNMIVAYDIIENSIEIITIHPISSSEVANKIETGRWKTYEKN